MVMLSTSALTSKNTDSISHYQGLNHSPFLLPHIYQILPANSQKFKTGKALNLTYTKDSTYSHTPTVDTLYVLAALKRN